MSLNDQINTLKMLLGQCETEVASLQSGRKASGPRARKQSMQLKVGAHALRKMITEHTKGLPTKTRVKKSTEPPKDFDTQNNSKIEEAPKVLDTVPKNQVAPKEKKPRKKAV